MSSLTIAAIVAIVIGVISLFFGKAYYRIILALNGALIGYSLGVVLAADLGQNETVQLVAGIVGAVLLAILLYRYYGLAFFLFGAVMGAAAGVLLVSLLGTTGLVGYVIVIALVIIGAFIGNALKDPVIVIATAWAGATYIIYGVGILVPTLPLASPGTSGTNALVSLAIAVVLAIIGASFQFRTRRR